HQALSTHVVQRQGYHHQRPYPASKVAELPPGAGDPSRKNHHGRRIFVGLFEFVALQPRVPEIFRSCSVGDSQGAARWSVPGLSLRIELPQRRYEQIAAHACGRWAHELKAAATQTDG